MHTILAAILLSGGVQQHKVLACPTLHTTSSPSLHVQVVVQWAVFAAFSRLPHLLQVPAGTTPYSGLLAPQVGGTQCSRGTTTSVTVLTIQAHITAAIPCQTKVPAPPPNLHILEARIAKGSKKSKRKQKKQKKLKGRDLLAPQGLLHAVVLTQLLGSSG